MRTGPGPGLNPTDLDGVDATAQLEGELDPTGTGTLEAAVFGGQSAQPGAVGSGDRVQAALSLFGAGENPGGVELAAGAAAVGFAAAGSEQVDGPGRHGIGALEATQEGAEEAIIGPELLAEPGEGVGHIFIG